MFGRATIRLGIGPHSSFDFYDVVLPMTMSWVIHLSYN